MARICGVKTVHVEQIANSSLRELMADNRGSHFRQLTPPLIGATNSGFFIVLHNHGVTHHGSGSEYLPLGLQHTKAHLWDNSAPQSHSFFGTSGPRCARPSGRHKTRERR